MLADSIDPEQTPPSAESDLGLHCLPVFQKWDAGLISVNQTTKRQENVKYPCNLKFDHWGLK